jgi:hypothetical protein
MERAAPDRGDEDPAVAHAARTRAMSLTVHPGGSSPSFLHPPRRCSPCRTRARALGRLQHKCGCTNGLAAKGIRRYNGAQRSAACMPCKPFRWGIWRVAGYWPGFMVSINSRSRRAQSQNHLWPSPLSQMPCSRRYAKHLWEEDDILWRIPARFWR